MTARQLVAVCVLVAGGTVLQAQDAVKTDPTHYKVLIDNPSVRVLDITYAPGAQSIMHHHPDTIVVPLVSSEMEFTMPDGKSQSRPLEVNTASYSAAETHNPKNAGTGAMHAILVEFKGAAPGKA